MSAASGVPWFQRAEPLRSVLRLRYERRFRTAAGSGCWSGVYQSFDEARRAAPLSLPVGYNHSRAAMLYDDMLANVQTKDYPALYWLHRVLAPGDSVFDLGGNIGVSYYTFRRYLADVEPATWTVCDVPAVLDDGRSRAAAQGHSDLRFTSDFDAASGSNVLFTSGTVQYIESPFHVMVDALAEKPAHIIINMLPTMPERSVVTLQNIGISYCPYRIMARGAIAAALQSVGYRLEDSWVNPEERTRIPYADGTPDVTWIGQYFRRQPRTQ